MNRDNKYLVNLLMHQSCAAKARSADGRGPLFWAYEVGSPKMVEALVSFGADPNAQDSNGLTPKDLETTMTADEDIEEDDDEFDDYDEEDYEEDEEDEDEAEQEGAPDAQHELR